jgi:Flp pilus assembly protein TadD
MRYLSSSLLAAALFAAIPAGAQETQPKPLKQETLQQIMQAAQAMQAKGDLQGALAFYEKVLAADPTNAESLYGAAETMLAMGLGLDSTKYYSRFAQARPTDVRGPIGLARAYNRANRPADALLALDGAKKSVSNSVIAAQERGIALDLLGRHKEAQTTYADGLKLAPKNLELLRRMALSFAITEDYQTSLGLLQTVANEPGGAVTIRDALAMVYAISGQPDAAVKIISIGDKDEAAKQRLAFFQTLSVLNQAQKAQAVHFGYVPADIINQKLAVLAAAKSQPPMAEPALPDRQANAPDGIAAKPAAKPARAGKPVMIALPQPDGSEPSVSQGAETVQPVQAAAQVTGPVRGAPLPAADRFWVQLAASPNRTRLLQDWNKAAQNANGGLSGYAPYLQSDMINYQPILRLVVGGFFDASTAQAMIGRLKTLGVAAIMKRNALPADPLFP